LNSLYRQMNAKSSKRSIQPWGTSVYIIAVLILVSLGTWQLARGMHKAELEKKMDMFADNTMGLETAPEDWNDLNYREVRLTGKPQTAGTMLLDSRIYQGQIGYEVIVPFVLQDQSAIVLLNRGWVSREQVNMLENEAVYGDMKIAGQLYLPKTGMKLVDTMLVKDRWPRVIAYLDIPVLSEELGASLAPAVVVLDSNSDFAFEKIWKPYIMSPMRHYGYAVQWWGLALVLLAFGWVWKFRSQG